MSDGLTDKRGGNDESAQPVKDVPLMARDNPEYKRIAWLIQQGKMARRIGASNPYDGQSVEHMLHSTGWVMEDIRLALCKKDPAYASRWPEESKEPSVAVDNEYPGDAASTIRIEISGAEGADKELEAKVRSAISEGVAASMREYARRPFNGPRSRLEDSYGQGRPFVLEAELAQSEDDRATLTHHPLVDQGDPTTRFPTDFLNDR